MKHLIAATSVFLIAACSEPATEAPVDDEVVVQETASAMAAVGGPGTYEVTYADGSIGTVTSTADNTFTATVGDQTVNGTVSEADGKVCFDFEAEDMETRCWTNGDVAADGSWSSTADDGEVVTVRPADAAAQPAA